MKPISFTDPLRIAIWLKRLPVRSRFEESCGDKMGNGWRCSRQVEHEGRHLGVDTLPDVGKTTEIVVEGYDDTER